MPLAPPPRKRTHHIGPAGDLVAGDRRLSDNDQQALARPAMLTSLDAMEGDDGATDRVELQHHLAAAPPPQD
jgi:hypothetical protein